MEVLIFEAIVHMYILNLLLHQLDMRNSKWIPPDLV